MSSTQILSTERLQLREFNLADATFIIELVNSPKWLEFIGDRNITNIADAENYLNTGPINSYKENGFGLWHVALRQTNEPIGMCGLLKRDTLEHVDIGFAFLPQYVGQGYGTEIAQATLRYANSELRIGKVVAITDKKNIASQKLLNNIGLYFEKCIQSPEGETLSLFSQ